MEAGGVKKDDRKPERNGERKFLDQIEQGAYRLRKVKDNAAPHAKACGSSISRSAGSVADLLLTSPMFRKLREGAGAAGTDEPESHSDEDC